MGTTKIARRYGIWRRIISLAVCVSFIWWNLSYAAPTGGTVVAGGATITQNGNVTQINQSTAKAVINWSSFDTTSTEQVNFSQPDSSSIALNRITSGLPTMFAGLLTANGQVWILNPAGVLFTKTSRVDVSGLLVSTADITNNNFLNGNYQFTAVPGFANGAVVNEGEIIAHGGSFAGNGLVALVAPGVANDGVISANLGKVVLASGTAYTLDLYGDQLIQFATDSKVQQVAVAPDGRILKDAVSNNGKIEANGGQVLLTANTAGKIVDNVISMNGVIEAKTATQGKNGVIILGGDEGVVKVTGKIDTSANNVGNGGKITIKGDKVQVTGQLISKGGSESGDGGFVETSGNYLDINQMQLDLTATNGKGGTWYLDPWNIEIIAGSGTNNNTGATAFTPTGTPSQIGADLIVGQLNSGVNVILDTSVGIGADPLEAGTITVNSAITKTVANSSSLTFLADSNVIINQPIDLSVGTGSFNITSGGAVTFGAAVKVAGDLNVAANGAITQSAPLTVGGSSDFSTGAFVITLNNSNNDFMGPVSLSNSGTNNVSLRDLNNIQLDAVTLGQDLTITAGGTITQTPTSVLDLRRLNSTSIGGITLNNANSMAQLNITNSGGGDVDINNAQALTVRNINLSGGGDVNVTNTANITVSVSGITTDGGDVTLTPTNAGATVRLLAGINASTGDITFNKPVQVRATVALTAANTLFTNTVNALNAGVQGLTINGNATFDNTVGNTTALNFLTVTGQTNLNTNIVKTTNAQDYQGAVTLLQPTTNFTGSLVIFGDTLSGTSDTTITGNASFNNQVNLKSLHVTGTTDVSSSSITTTNAQTYDGSVTINTDTTLSGTPITFNNTVTGSNDLAIQTNADFTITNPITLTGASLNINSTGGVHFNAATDVGNDLTVTANGVIDQTAKLVVGGTSSFSTGAYNIDLSNALNDFGGAVSLSNTGTNNVSINDINALVLGTSNIGGDLTVTTNGAITQTGDLTVNGASSFSAGANPITLTNAGNDFIGEVTLNNSGANDIQITDANNLILGASSVGHDLIVNAASTHLTGDSTAGNDITFNSPVTLDTDILLTAVKVFFNDTVDADTSGSQGLKVSGDAKFINQVGFNAALKFLEVTGVTEVATDLVQTTLAQDYDGAVNLLSLATNFVGSVVSFHSTVDGNSDVAVTGDAVFEGSVGATPLNSLHVTGSTTLNSGVTSITTNNAQNYDGAVTSNATSNNFVGTLITFGSTLDGASDVTVTGDAVFNNEVGFGAALNSLHITGTTLFDNSADLVKTTNTQAYDGAVTIDPASINFDGSTITFGSTVDGASAVTVTGDAVFNDEVGFNTALNSLHVTGTTTVDNNADLINTANAQDYDGAITVNTTDTNFQGSTITFGSTLDGASDVTVTGNAVFNDEVGFNTALNSLHITGTTLLDNNADLIKTANAQGYDGAVTVNTTDTNFQGSTITFGSTLDGASDVTVTGNAVFNDEVGFNTALNSLHITGTTLLDNNANLIKTVNAQDYDGAVTINPASINFDGSDITFGSTVDGASDVTVTGNAVFEGSVGATPLNSLHVTGSTTLNSGVTSITTNNAQNYDGAVTSNATSNNFVGTLITFGSTLDGASAITITGDAAFNDEIGAGTTLDSLHITGTTLFDNSADLVKTTNTQTYDGAVTINPASINFDGSTITFGSTVDGASAVTVTGDAVFNDEVGFNTALNSLHVTGTTTVDNNADLINTANAQDYDGAVTVNTTDTNFQGSTITFGSTLDGASDVTVTGNAVFNDEVGFNTALNSLHITGTTLLDNNADLIKTVNAQDYDGAVTINPVSVNFDGSTITFGSTVDGVSDVTVSGDAVFNDEVGFNTALNSLHVTGTTLLDNNADLIKTANAQDYDGAVTINPVIVTFQGSTITFGGTLDGASDVMVTGDAVFNDEVGFNTPLNSLHITGAILVDNNADLIKTTNAQNYDGAVTVNTTDTNFQGSTITFGSTVDGASDVTVTGDVVFNDEVGFNTALSSLHITGTTLLDNNADLIKTVNSQGYDGAVIINPASVNFDGGTITFGNTVDGASNVTVMGNAVFNDKVGASTTLSSLHLTGSTTIDNNANLIKTASAQDYDGAVTVNTTNTNLQGSTITFGNTLDGASNITITGDAVFNNEVGFNTALNSLHITGTTLLDNNADLVKTTGTQKYDGAVTFNPATINFQGSTITFNDTLDGASDVTVTGNAVFNDRVGSNTALDSLHVTGNTTINTDSVNSNNTQDYDGAVILLQNTTLQGSTVNFDSSITGNSNNLTVTGNGIFHAINGVNDLLVNGNADFNGVVGSPIGLNSIHITGNTNINTSLIKALMQAYDSSVMVLTNSTLQGTQVNFDSAVDGSNNLTIDANAIFNGQVGSSTPLDNLTVNGTTSINSDLIKTAALQHYIGAVTLGVDTVLDTPTTLIFDNTIDGTNNNQEGLTINGNPTFKDKIGSLVPLEYLIINGNSTFSNNASSVTTGGNQIYNGTMTLQRSVSLDAGSTGDIVFNTVNGGGNTLTVVNAHDVTGNGPVNVGNFNQNSGTGTTNFPSGLQALNNILIFTNFIAGGSYTGNIIALSGTNGVNGNVTANQFFLGGQAGGNLTVSIVGGGSGQAAANNSKLLAGSSGAFYVNGYLVTGFGDLNAALNPNLQSICASGNCGVLFTPEASLQVAAGTVFCMMGFATAVDASGNERILLPGDQVYMDEKIVTDKDTRVTVRYNTGDLQTIHGSQEFNVAQGDNESQKAA